MAADNSRSFLADEVRAQRLIINDLLSAVAGLERSTGTLERTLAALVIELREDRQGAKDDRRGIYEQIHAQRMEQIQLALGVSGVKATVDKLVTTVDDHETERQQTKGGLKLAIASSRTAWVVVGALLLAGATAYIRFFATPPGH